MENKKLVTVFLLVLMTCVSSVFSQNSDSLELINASTASDEKIKALSRHLETRFPGTDRRYISALLASGREVFLPRELREYSYIDISLPAGGDKIIVSYSDILKALTAVENPQIKKVLIIGRNSGFAASVFSGIFENVFLTELDVTESDRFGTYYADKFPTLAVAFTTDREYFRDEAPFDLIFFSGALREFSGQYIDLLSSDGEILFPMRDSDGFQLLYRAVREDDSYSLSTAGEVFFPDIE